MNSREYWERRALLRKVQAERGALRTADEIGEAYDRAVASLQKDISYWLSRFADNNALSLADAKRLLRADELKEFRWTVEEYISHGAQNADGRWAKQLENASVRVHISRLETMQTLLRAQAEELAGKELGVFERLLSDTYRDQYLKRAFDLQKGLGVGWSVQRPDPRMVKILLKKPWAADGAAFSDRIWKDKESLVRELDRALTQSLITGKYPDAAAQMLVDKLGAGKRQARRLVFTEAAAVSTLAEKDCYTDLGVGEYEILATLDSKTSEICRSMDGRHFPVSEMKPGVTAPPFHPNCRTDTCPYFDDWAEFGSPSRAARDAADQGYELVPAGMTYREWEKRFVREKSVANSAESGIIRINKATKSAQRILNLKDISQVHIPAQEINVAELAFDDNHINVERAHKVTFEQAVQWLKQSKISVTVWNGRYERFYGDEGTVYVDRVKKEIRTAFSVTEYTDNVKKLMEVLKKYGL